MANIIIESTRDNFSISLPVDLVRERIPNSTITYAINHGVMWIGGLQFIFDPAILLLIKYLVTGTILNNTNLTPLMMNAIHRIYLQDESLSLAIASRSWNIPELANLTFITEIIRNPQIPSSVETSSPTISPQITLQIHNKNAEVTFNGLYLYNLTRNGYIGLAIKLAPDVEVIQFDDMEERVIQALSELAEPPINPDDSKQLSTAGRYFLIDDLMNTITQAYLVCEGQSNTEVLDPVQLYSEPYNYGVYISRSLLLQKYPNSMLTRTLDLDPNTSQIPVYNLNITSGALDAVKVLLESEAIPYLDLVEASHTLGIPELANLYLSELMTCMSE